MSIQKNTFRRFASFVLAAVIAAGTASTVSFMTSASGINPAEQRILDELNTTVDLNGKTRGIPYRYVKMARYYFDTMTCISDDQADYIISKIKEAKTYIESTGVSNFTDMSDEDIDHLIGIANEASGTAGIALRLTLDKNEFKHKVDTECDNNPNAEVERISLSDENRTIDSNTRKEILDHIDISKLYISGSFNDWGNKSYNRDLSLSDSDGDGIYRGTIAIENVTEDMISELESNWIPTGKYGIQFKIRSGSSEYSWGEYESDYGRTTNSRTNFCVEAKPGDSIIINVKLDTTKVSRYAEKTASQYGMDVFTAWDTSFSVDKLIKAEGIQLDKTKVDIDIGSNQIINATVFPSNAFDKTISWTSSDESKATVEDGRITGISEGTATITAKTYNGKEAICIVTVKDPVIDVSGIELDKSSVTLEKGKTATIKATISPENATNKNVIWSSSNTSAVTVNNGTITAVAAGTATVTAKSDNGKSASCTVIVKNPVVEVTNVTLNKTSLNIEKGKSYTLTASVAPANATSKTIIWTTSNRNVITVSGGKLTAVSAGTAIITAKSNNGKTARCTVTVKNPEIYALKISLSKTSAVIEKGKTLKISASFTPENTTNKKVNWISSDTSVATVTDGTITAKSLGTATITASSINGKTASCTVTVKNPSIPVTEVRLNKSAVTLGKGETYSLSASVSPSNATDKNVKWRTSNSKILTVDQKGNVRTLGTGVAWVTARSASGKEKSCKFTVRNAPSKVTLTKGVVTIGVGEKFSLGSAVNNGAASSKRTYRTSNKTILRMTRTDWQGDFVAQKPGVAYVTVRTYNGKESTCKVTVKNAPSKVKLNRSALTLKVGQSAALSASIPAKAGCATRVFRTDNTNVIKMTKTNWTGAFTALQPGTAYVTVRTYNGKEASCKVTVIN